MDSMWSGYGAKSEKQPGLSESKFLLSFIFISFCSGLHTTLIVTHYHKLLTSVAAVRSFASVREAQSQKYELIRLSDWCLSVLLRPRHVKTQLARL